MGDGQAHVLGGVLIRTGGHLSESIADDHRDILQPIDGVDQGLDLRLVEQVRTCVDDVERDAAQRHCMVLGIGREPLADATTALGGYVDNLALAHLAPTPRDATGYRHREVYHDEGLAGAGCAVDDDQLLHRDQTLDQPPAGGLRRELGRLDEGEAVFPGRGLPTVEGLLPGPFRIGPEILEVICNAGVVTNRGQEIRPIAALAMSVQALEVAGRVAVGACREPDGRAVARLTGTVLGIPRTLDQQAAAAILAQDEGLVVEPIGHGVGDVDVVTALALGGRGDRGRVDRELDLEGRPQGLELLGRELGDLDRQAPFPFVSGPGRVGADGYELLAVAEELDHAALDAHHALREDADQLEGQEALGAVLAPAFRKGDAEGVSDGAEDRCDDGRRAHVDVEASRLAGLYADAVVGL